MNSSRWQLKGRFKSWALWIAILGLVGLLFNRIGVFDMLGIDEGWFREFVDYLGTILVAFGIVNNPTDHDNF